MKRAPAMFIGHGSPMNVIEKNSFNEQFKKLGENLTDVKAIICLSAHYQTDGIEIDKSEHPKTIYDFRGFPDILYTMKYGAQGSIEIANKIKNLLGEKKVKLTTNWGLDHGAWNVLWHLVPRANIPIVMMSLDYKLTFNEHFQIGKTLRSLRDEGIMIMGSGNIVHSFRGINFNNDGLAHPSATAFNKYVRENIIANQFENLIQFPSKIQFDAQFSVNSAEHYIPLLYVLGASYENEIPFLFNDEIVYSTLSMQSLAYGLESTINGQ